MEIHYGEFRTDIYITSPIEPDGIQAHYGDLVVQYFATLGRDQSCNALSNMRFYGPGFELWAALAGRGFQIDLVQILAPDELEPPLGEEVELVDSETGELRPTRLGPVELSAYRAHLEGFLADVSAQCRKLGVVHVTIDTGTPIQETVLKQLTAAGVLAG